LASETIPLTFTVDTSGVTSQSLSISGAYNVFGGSTSFTVPSNGTVAWFSVSSNVPAVTLPKTGTTVLSPITITQPAGLATGALTGTTANASVITLTAGANATFSTATTPTVSAVPAATTAPTIAVAPGGATATVSLPAVPSASIGGSWTISNLSVTTNGASIGAQTVDIATTFPTEVLFSGVMVGTVLGSSTTIFGPNGTADGTVAAEFENAYPSGNTKVVLATDAAHTNGSDALAASYLEGMLGTGLLITSPSSLGSDAINAMRIEGVSTVYVVGGPLAISPAVVAQVEALPVYNAGGLTLASPSANIKVVAQIAGTDGTAEGTAAQIATYFGSFNSLTFSGAYTASGIGAYNDTTGTGSVVAPTGAVPTAIVVASSDWQDAVTIAPEAFRMRVPVILAGPSSSTTLGTDASAALTSLHVKQVILVGGQLAVQNSVEAQIAALNSGISVLRIAGIDATDTAAQIANFALSTAGAGTGLGYALGAGANSVNGSNVIVSHGDYWTDALGAAALGGDANPTSFGFEPILVTESPTVVGPYTGVELAKLGALASNAATGLTVLGGPLAMPASTVNQLLSSL
jgi:putative cell wall-binding protein